MKFSICSTWGKKNNKPLEDVVEMAATLKLEGIELWDVHIEDYIRRHDCSLQDLKDYLAENHLKCCGIAPYFNMLTEDEAQKSIALAEKCIHYAKELECQVIRTFVGYKPSKELTNEEWDRCISTLRTMTNMVENKDIYFALETHSNQPSDNADSIVYLINQVGNQQLKVIFDGFNFIIDELDLMESYKKLKTYIVHYHMKNYHWTHESRIPTPLNEGNADFTDIIKKIKKTKYDKYISFEYFSSQPEELIRKSVDWIFSID